MQIKSFKLLSIMLMMLTVMLIITGCGKSGNRLGNQAPEIQITSFEGWDSTYVAAGYNTALVYSFHQRIYWHAWDKDGIVTGYAFRVLDENGKPIATPGYEHLSSAADNLIPQNLLDLDPRGGWVIHYVPGEDETNSLDSLATRRTIWTSQKYAEINFPAADEDGNPLQKASRFEVVAIDNRGAITSNVAWRNFATTSIRPTCVVSTTKGNANGKIVGAGLKLSFSMGGGDPALPTIPFKYEFQLQKTDLLGTVITPPESLVWIDTKTQHVEAGQLLQINQFLLNLRSNPPISYDYDANGNAISKTRVIARVTDRGGVVSLTSSGTVMTFQVKAGFSPKSLVYGKKTYAMGDYHYEDWGDATTPEVLPTQFTQGAQRWATPFFKDLEGKNTAVYSNNLKLWLRWGWSGEYAKVENDTVFIYEDQNPYGKKVDVVRDRNTGVNYLSEITYYWLRYDNDAYDFPPYAHLRTQDASGDWWLRIPVTSVIGQSILLTGLPIPDNAEPGEHVFQIACEDLQGVVDPIPAEFRFYLHRYNPPSLRSGVLVIDDDKIHNSYSPQVAVQSYYESLFQNYTGTPRFINQSKAGLNDQDTYSDARNRQLALSDLQKYKMVLYHNDNPSAAGRLEEPDGLVNNADALALYMLNGGNLVVSHTSRLTAAITDVSPFGRRNTLINAMGIPNSSALKIMSTSVNTNPFFYKAISSATGFNDIALNTTDSYFNLINTRYKGIGSVAYFKSATGETIYKLGCKPVGTDNYSPADSTIFNSFANQPVGIRKTNPSGGKAYTFGFPLSYMVADDARAMINTIISECGVQ
ncbi:MAG: hypothetical protein PHY48_00030 [Candidatus Cloacimonetes bacterium]|nr:hypothetical protein [Candidatus Cloacimonadota bacterium]